MSSDHKPELPCDDDLIGELRDRLLDDDLPKESRLDAAIEFVLRGFGGYRDIDPDAFRIKEARTTLRLSRAAGSHGLRGSQSSEYPCRFEHIYPAGADHRVIKVFLVLIHESNESFVRLEGFDEEHRYVAWMPEAPDDHPAPPPAAIPDQPRQSTGLLHLFVPDGARSEWANRIYVAEFLKYEDVPQAVLAFQVI